MLRELFDSNANKVKDALLKRLGRNSGLAAFLRVRWIPYLCISAVVIMAAGIVNTAVQSSGVSSTLTIYPGSGFQSIPETAINIFDLFLGAGGIYLAYLSRRQTTRPRMTGFYLLLGLTLLGIALYMGIYIVGAKGG
jgi:hypothetical protein